MKLKTLLILVLVLATPSFAIPRATGATKAAVVAAPKVDPGLIALMKQAGPSGKVAGFVTFRPDVTHPQALSTFRRLGLHVSVDLASIDAAYVYGPVKGFTTLTKSSSVQRLQADHKLPLLRSTGPWATRAREVYTQTGGLDMRIKDANGHYVDGSGVGIAIVDSGIDALHPDLQWCQSPGAFQSTCKTKVNFKVRCTTFFLVIGLQDPSTNECFSPVVMRDVPDSDSSAGHGTHVSGIAAGSGKSSIGATSKTPFFEGVAPGAKLYGFGSGEVEFIDTFAAAASFEWIIKNGANQKPPIKVINNSYGAPGFDDPTDILTRLSNKAIAKGITVVWAAGNSGAGPCTPQTDPTTTIPCTSVNANNRTPGNLSIANYDDGGTGSRDNALESDSSQGIAGQPSTYPTVAAPGSSISSTCLPYIPDCSAYGTFALPEPAYQPYYTVLSGTSMASPHAVGVVALLYQANPSITPAQVQSILEDTAHKFTSGAAYDANGTSVDKGHGLIDAHAAVLEAMNLPADTGLDQAATPETVVADRDTGDQSTTSLDLVRVAIDDDAANNRVNVSWTLHALSTKPQSTPFRYQLNASVDGTKRTLSVDWDGHHVSCSQDLAADCVASQSGTTFTASYDAAAFGAVKGAPIFDVWASTFGGIPNSLGLPCYGGSIIGLLDIPAPCMTDRVPGVDGKKPAGATAYLTPERGPSHIFTFTGTASTAPDPCVAPGLPILSDPSGDSLDQQSGHDVVGLSIAEIGADKLMFTLRTASLATLPKSTTWPLQFTGANGTAHEVDMVTDATGAVSFTVDGAAADASSTYFPDGRIEIVAPRSAVGATNAGDTIHGFLTRVTIDPVGITPDNMPDSLTPAGAYTVSGTC